MKVKVKADSEPEFGSSIKRKEWKDETDRLESFSTVSLVISLIRRMKRSQVSIVQLKSWFANYGFYFD